MSNSVLRTLNDLESFFEADTAAGLNRRIYKDTACRASISLLCANVGGQKTWWLHNGQDREQWEGLDAPGCRYEAIGFTIQTIVEGSDAEVNSDLFLFPVEVAQVDAWMVEMESEAAALWREANEDEEEEEEEEESMESVWGNPLYE